MTWLFDIYLDSTPEFAIICSLLSDPSSTSNAVNNIIKLTCEAVIAEHGNEEKVALGKHFQSTVGSVLELAARTSPNEQQSLLDFLLELRQWEVPDKEGELLLRYADYHDARVWMDLPMLGITVRDMCDEGQFKSS